MLYGCSEKDRDTVCIRTCSKMYVLCVINEAFKMFNYKFCIKSISNLTYHATDSMSVSRKLSYLHRTRRCGILKHSILIVLHICKNLIYGIIRFYL